ncbi:MAG: VanZ family protein [Lachnospiraceae bacterium]|nr:VanZ family protein [Lachnospiraceae bacterium]MBR3510163.1 VanZ family protein [Lachnospiraceae bacterium]MBR4604927.1 VanZ family protein [Lachnospiraceae bacterium]MBR6150175.1 VanZ family protein [Lachnospiraceae bacterium]
MSNDKIIRIDRKQKRIKVAVSIVAAIFLIVLYGLIFSFSEQDGATSGHLSHEVSKWIVEGWERLIGMSWTEEIRNGWIDYWEHPVRKLAHFSEYTVMGILVFFTLNPWMKPGWKKNLLIILWVFVSAALDEWHQTFVADRCGNFMDVLLDTSGGCFGLLLCLFCLRICEGIRRKKGAV